MSTLSLDTDVREEAKKKRAAAGGKEAGGGEAKETAPEPKFDAIAEGDEEEELTSGDAEDDGM